MSDLIVASEFGLDEQKAGQIEQAFAPLVAEKKGLTEIYEGILTKELCTDTYKEAALLRNKLTKVGTGIDKVHKTQKAFALSYGRFVDAWKNKEKEPIQQMKDRLMLIVKHEELEIAKAEDELKDKRQQEIMKYVESYPEGLGVMDESIYQSLKKGIIIEFEEKKAAEKKAEEDRILAEKTRKEEEERIRKENAKLKADAEANEKKRLEEDKKRKEIEAKRLEAEAKERAKIEEESRIEREKQEAILKKEREAKEKIEAELKAKQEAEELVKKVKAASEKADAEAKRQANLAPEKDKIAVWIESFNYNEIDVKEFSKEGKETVLEVVRKFTAFKQWALTQKDSIK